MGKMRFGWARLHGFVLGDIGGFLLGSNIVLMCRWYLVSFTFSVFCCVGFQNKIHREAEGR